MAKGRTRVKGAKGKRWRKGQSGSSNPSEISHRQAARGKFSDHLSRGKYSAALLTAAALASHEQENAARRDDDANSCRSTTVATSAASSSALTLIETAHPVFGAVRKLWNSPTESHRVICAVLAAVSEVVKAREGRDTATEYFGALMSVLESSEDEKSVAAISYLLCLLLPSVSRDVLQLKYGTTCKIFTQQLTLHETSSSTALLKSLVRALTLLLEAQSLTTWETSHCQKVFQTILHFTIYPKPKLRKAAQTGVVELLREGTVSGGTHTAAISVANHCRHVIERGGVEKATLYVLGMLRECLTNLPTMHIKTLCEVILKTMTLGGTLMRTTCLHTLHGVMVSVSGPQGLTAELTARLTTALYDHQPSLTDGQLLEAWLTAMLAAHLKLARLDQGLCVLHLVRFFATAVSCLLSHKTSVSHTSATAMQTLLSEVVGPYVTSVGSDPQHTIQKIYMSVAKGLEYKYQLSWRHVLQTLTVFHRVAGETCNSVMIPVMPMLCSLHSLPDFKLIAELEEAVGVAIATMGPQAVLSRVPLKLDCDQYPPSFSRSWLLPVLRDHVSRTNLSFFTTSLLPLAGRMRARAERYRQTGQLLEAKLYTTLYHQVWSLLPGFCREPKDVSVSFPVLARILGTALSEREELRVTIATSLRQLVESSREKDEDRATLSRFSKNYLPILFNLYTGSRVGAVEERQAVLQCVEGYTTITDSDILTSLFSHALLKITQQDLQKEIKHRILDLVAVMVNHLPPASLQSVLDTVSPLLDSVDCTLQKKSYKVLQQLLSCEDHTHKTFVQHHLQRLTLILTDSLSTSSTACKKPRLRCLLCLVDHIGEDTIATVTPEVILCTKETNEKCRRLAYQLLVRIGYTAQHCYGCSAEEAVTHYMRLVIAGLTGSSHMVSATIISLSRLVYEFHDVLSYGIVRQLTTTMCTLLSSHTREVVKAAFGFIKITIRVLPPAELSPHLEELVTGVMKWSANPKSHFRLKARFILEKLIHKFGLEMVCGLVHVKHQKLLAHIKKSTERSKKRKRAAVAEGLEPLQTQTQKMSYEELLQDTEEEEEGGRREERKTGMWLKEGSGDDPVNLLDSSLASKISSTGPGENSRPSHQLFPTSPEGKLLISAAISGTVERVNVNTDNTAEIKQQGRKRKLSPPTAGGGGGIHRHNPDKQQFNYGSEYRAKRARGDVKVKGQPDPFAYVPLLTEKLNRRKRAKLVGQFAGLVKKARSGSAAGTRQRGRKR